MRLTKVQSAHVESLIIQSKAAVESYYSAALPPRHPAHFYIWVALLILDTALQARRSGDFARLVMVAGQIVGERKVSVLTERLYKAGRRGEGARRWNAAI